MGPFLLACVCIAHLVSAVPGPLLAGRATNVCTKSPYNLILPLKDYAPAQAFCSAVYPIPPVSTTTTTVTETASVKKLKAKRTPAPAAAPAATKDTKAKQWSSCRKKLSGNALKTACSCIETPWTSTATTTTIVQPEPTARTCTEQLYKSGDICYSVFCNSEYTIKIIISSGPATDVYDCADQCNSVEDCRSVNFDRTTLTCEFYSEAYNRANNGNVDGAVSVDVQLCPA